MTKELKKEKTHIKKLNVVPSNTEIDTFFTNQQNIVSRLKNELKSVISKVHLSDNASVEHEKRMIELEQSVNQRETEMCKLRANLDQLKSENNKMMLEFNYFKEKFYQLEMDYDKSLNLQNHNIEKLCVELQKEKNIKNQEVQELSARCQDLQQTLQNKINDMSNLNKLYIEILHNFEEMKTYSEQQQREFESYKIQAIEEKKLCEEKNKLDFDYLKEELKQKDEQIKQGIAERNALEKEKNLIIDELNNKICRIERVFTQPTKAVQPMATLANQGSDSHSSSEVSTENVAITKPQAHKPSENWGAEKISNTQNQNVQPNQMQRDYKFKRPGPSTASTEQINTSKKRIRRNETSRQPPAIKTYNEFSLSSSSDEDDPNDKFWRPNKDCYVADTDESAGFFKPKRSKI